ncbi:MAG: hypothetical protein KDC09_00085 [Bacteroidales bacterium]|nr:hypothetical protein [Bacteroidales bacterium]
MKKLQLHIALFLLPLVLLIALLPVNQRLKYNGLWFDCLQQGDLVYNRLYQNPKPVDVLFLGTSHTINGIDDKRIENKLGKDSLHVLNLGYCRLGRNLHYVLLKEVLQQKKPKILVLEVREKENRYTHPVFPHMANTADVLFAEPLFNKDLVSDIFTHGAYKLELWQDELYGNHFTNENTITDYGQGEVHDTASADMLLQLKTRNQSVPKTARMHNNWFYRYYPDSYLEKIARLCKANDIKLYFLYLPGFATPEQKPEENDSYEQWGTVLIPPNSLFENPDYWYDHEHLNKAGSAVLSDWIAAELRQDM